MTTGSDFSTIAPEYDQDALVQKSAGEILLDLLDIGEQDNVLDLGCGTGHLTRTIREKTQGLVVGMDPAPGMIARAKSGLADTDITFLVSPAERLACENTFDRIFTNSAFQWFTDHGQALRNCFNALKKGGKMAMQAPAGETYCPNFIDALEEVRQDPATRQVFACFRSPWLFRNTAEEYGALFTDAGFTVERAWIDRVATLHSPEEVYRIFESGAAAGYLNATYYDCRLPREYPAAFRRIIKKTFIRQQDANGMVELVFHRIYLLARRP